MNKAFTREDDEADLEDGEVEDSVAAARHEELRDAGADSSG